MQVILFVATIIGLSELVSTSPGQWVHFQGTRYLFGYEKMNFKEARTYCKQFFSHLVDVNTEAENTFIRNHLRQLKNGTYWLGMQDNTAKGMWYWSDPSSIVTFTDWIPGEPNDSNGENCAVFKSDADYKWSNIHCEERYHVLCEMYFWPIIIR